MKENVKLSVVVPEEINASREEWFHGESKEEVLEKLHRWAFYDQDFTKIEGCTFQLSGDSRLFEFNATMFHYCFDKGRISVEDLLERVCYED